MSSPTISDREQILATVGNLSENIHNNLFKNFKYARIWGDSLEYQGQRVGIDHELTEADIVEIVISR